MLSVFRIVAGAIFITSGTMKLFGYPHSPVPMPAFELFSEIGIAGILETYGGPLIVLGLFTRPVAFVLAGEMAYAYFKYHAPNSFFPTVNMGIPAILYCFLFLYLMLEGGGPWSLDAMIAKRKSKKLS